MLVISQQEIERLLTIDECIDVMSDALASLAAGKSLLPLRMMMHLPEKRGIFAMMPAAMSEPALFGLKAITVFPRNEGTEYDSHQGAVLLFEAEHGSVVALLDGSAITAIRTAAVSGVATRELARPDSMTLALLGSGVQAWTHLEAMVNVRPIADVRVWSRSPEHARGFARRAAEKYHVNFSAVATAKEAVSGADIVCTLTSSYEPVLEGQWLAPGTHLNVIGASQPAAREVSSDTVQRARVYVDRRESALNESGDILTPIREGLITKDHIVAELGELLLDPAKGRRSRDDITLFKSLGLAIEDVAAASRIYELAREQGVGTEVDLGGRRAIAH